MFNSRGRVFATLIVVAAGAVLSGCVAPSVVRQEPPTLPVAGKLQVELRLKQKSPYVNHDPSNTGILAGNQAGLQAAMNPAITHGTFAGGAAAGLIGALVGTAIDAAVNAHRSTVAEELGAPILAATASIEFNAMVESSLGKLDRQKFAQDIQVSLLATSVDEDEKARRLAPGEVLVIVPTYFVTYDESSFVYQIDATLVERHEDARAHLNSNVRYREIFRYAVPRSEFGGAAHWGVVPAERWQHMFEEACAEAIAMLNFDIAARPSDATATVKHGALSVHVERDNGARVWLRSPHMLESVPRAAVPEIKKG